MNKEKIPTRKEEVRYTTSDPKRMLNKYLVNNLFRTWKEDFVDKETQQVVSIQRNEIILERGTLLDKEKIAQIQFYMQEGSIEEVEVSNQKRMGYECENTQLRLYKAKVSTVEKNHTFILYASSITNAIEVLRDYLEQHLGGAFSISDVNLYDKVRAVIVDNLATRKKSNPELDKQFILGEISVEDYLEARVPDDEAEEEDTSKRIFYNMAVRVHYGAAASEDGKRIACEEEFIEDFIVHSYTATRANMLIEKYCNDIEKKRDDQWDEKHPESPALRRPITTFIEESKIFPVGCFIPLEFSEAHKEEPV